MAFDADLPGEWAEHGLISHDAATAIRQYEDARVPTHGGVREILGYVGAILVLIAGFVLVGQMWVDMKRGGRIAVSGLAAAILVGAGVSLVSGTSRSTRRMGEVALMLAAAPIGLAVGLTFGEPADEEPMATMAFAGALIYSIVVYRWHPSWAQHIALVASAIGGAIALGISVTDQNMYVSAAMVGIVGVGLLLASWRNLLPPRVLSEVGAIAALGLASIFVVGDLAPDTTGGRLAMVACVVASTGLIAAGVHLDRLVLIAGGALGLLGYLPVLIDELVPGEAGGPIALLAAGLVLIGSAVLLTRAQQHR